MHGEEFRALGHQLIDRLADYIDSVDGETLFPDAAPDHVAALFDEPVPREGMAGEALLAELDANLFPYCTHVNHPGYMGLITPTSLPIGALGDLIASVLNQNLGTYTIGPSAVTVERRTIRWLCDLLKYPADAGGNLTSGGTMANTLGVKLARDFASGQTAQHDGLSERWAVYTSEERHVSVDKAVDACGVGRAALRALPTDDQFRLRLDALEQAITQDKAAGIRPMCIVAMAGTTNSGAIDDLRALRTIADREGMWLHADAAYGGGMLLSREWPGLLDGVELADSITIDPHKWFFAPLDVGAILVRDATQLTASYGLQPSYLTDEMDTGGERYQYYVHGFEQSRRFRALKVWLSFKRYGTDQIGTWIDANVHHARHLYERVQANSSFRAAVAPVMSALCVRFEDARLTDEDAVGRLHTLVARQIEEDGRYWISTAVLKGQWWFRINPVNFRTRAEHMDGLLALLQERCEAVVDAM